MFSEFMEDDLFYTVAFQPFYYFQQKTTISHKHIHVTCSLGQKHGKVYFFQIQINISLNGKRWLPGKFKASEVVVALFSQEQVKQTGRVYSRSNLDSGIEDL